MHMIENIKHLVQSPAQSHTPVISIITTAVIIWASLLAQMVNNLLAMQETRVQALGREGPLEKGLANHSSILAWRIPWTEELGGLQSTGSQSWT